VRGAYAVLLQDKGFVAAVLEHWLGSREDKAPSLDGGELNAYILL
jgi:hypothetical protein